MFDTDYFPYADVQGPAAATNNAIALFNGTTGKILKDSGVTLPNSALVGVSTVQSMSNKTIVFSSATSWAGGSTLEVRGNGAAVGDSTSGAFMSFHRPSSFALNLGLDENNVFKLSGWSLGTTVPWSVTSGGVMCVRSAVYFTSQQWITASGASTTVNFANGQKVLLYLQANTTVSFAFPGVGNYLILVVQDGVGNRSVTWSGIAGYVGGASAPQLVMTANGYTVISVYWNGSGIFLGGSKVNA